MNLRHIKQGSQKVSKNFLGRGGAAAKLPRGRPTAARGLTAASDDEPPRKPPKPLKKAAERRALRALAKKQGSRKSQRCAASRDFWEEEEPPCKPCLLLSAKGWQAKASDDEHAKQLSFLPIFIGARSSFLRRAHTKRRGQVKPAPAFLVCPPGIEPGTYSVGGCHSIQLRYGHMAYMGRLPLL